MSNPAHGVIRKAFGKVGAPRPRLPAPTSAVGGGRRRASWCRLIRTTARCRETGGKCFTSVRS